ncbi:hypothetical protein DYBT9275_03106 [Dyadobacter sp. CECT 9275]|uniref:Signal transduction histidine kinase internal region domain-containing protein n=1 Tax=Dyadobacter helix TaxID=2822344 RepID=A0A916JDF2_9BACT|nr:histidine kinase [Dyadobacter sp. CECT 9275]CAG5003234.1 hypothetical protein DYBT9275_03106 [Dyadobacter sp. CECT 9275]
MIVKPTVLAVCVLLIFKIPGFAQRITVFGKAPVRIEGQGLLIKQMRDRRFVDDIGSCPVEKVVPVYLSGSWITIQTTDSPYGSSLSFSEGNRENTLYLNHYKYRKLYARLFYTQTPISGQTYIPPADRVATTNRKVILSDHEMVVYSFLKVNDFFFLDFLDYKTDSLVRRYYIKRVKTEPRIHAFVQQARAKYAGNKYADTKIVLDKQYKLLLLPDRQTRFMLSGSPRLTDSSVRYDLANLKTGDTLHYTGAGRIIIPGLAAGTQYVLKLYDEFQPETVRVYFLDIQPYWYRSNLFYFLAGVLIFSVSVLFVLIRQRRRARISRQEQTETEQHLRMVQSQLNPHFTFNALSSIQGLINTGRIDEANHYLREFSLLLRKTLERDQHAFNTLDREIQMMQTYIGLEQLRFRFHFEISLSPNLNPSETNIPTLLLQPLLENAIKHGISELGENGLLSVNFIQETDKLIVVIKDNGKGFDHSSVTGYGLRLTRERILAINGLLGEKKIEFFVNNRIGTEVTILFHHWIDIS